MAAIAVHPTILEIAVGMVGVPPPHPATADALQAMGGAAAVRMEGTEVEGIRQAEAVDIHPVAAVGIRRVAVADIHPAAVAAIPVVGIANPEEGITVATVRMSSGCK